MMSASSAEQAIGDEVFGRGCNSIDIPLVITVALLQRQARIATREALRLGSRKGEKAAGPVTKIALAKSGSPIVPRDICADRGAYRDRADPRNVETVSVNPRQFVRLVIRASAVGIPLIMKLSHPASTKPPDRNHPEHCRCFIIASSQDLHPNAMDRLTSCFRLPRNHPTAYTLPWALFGGRDALGR
jgi:hypothetical protein